MNNLIISIVLLCLFMAVPQAQTFELLPSGLSNGQFYRIDLQGKEDLGDALFKKIMSGIKEGMQDTERKKYGLVATPHNGVCSKQKSKKEAEKMVEAVIMDARESGFMDGVPSIKTDENKMKKGKYLLTVTEKNCEFYIQKIPDSKCKAKSANGPYVVDVTRPLTKKFREKEWCDTPYSKSAAEKFARKIKYKYAYSRSSSGMILVLNGTKKKWKHGDRALRKVWDLGITSSYAIKKDRSGKCRARKFFRSAIPKIAKATGVRSTNKIKAIVNKVPNRAIPCTGGGDSVAGFIAKIMDPSSSGPEYSTPPPGVSIVPPESTPPTVKIVRKGDKSIISMTKKVLLYYFKKYGESKTCVPGEGEASSVVSAKKKAKEDCNILFMQQIISDAAMKINVEKRMGADNFEFKNRVVYKGKLDCTYKTKRISAGKHHADANCCATKARIVKYVSEKYSDRAVIAKVVMFKGKPLVIPPPAPVSPKKTKLTKKPKTPRPPPARRPAGSLPKSEISIKNKEIGATVTLAMWSKLVGDKFKDTLREKSVFTASGEDEDLVRAKDYAKRGWKDKVCLYYGNTVFKRYATYLFNKYKSKIASGSSMKTSLKISPSISRNILKSKEIDSICHENQPCLKRSTSGFSSRKEYTLGMAVPFTIHVDHEKNSIKYIYEFGGYKVTIVASFKCDTYLPFTESSGNPKYTRKKLADGEWKVTVTAHKTHKEFMSCLSLDSSKSTLAIINIKKVR